MIYFLVNPASHSGKTKPFYEQTILPILEREQVVFKTFFSQSPGDLTQLTHRLIEKSKDSLTIILIGGDGSINEVLQGIQDFSKVTLGFIPAGSGNDLARDFYFPKDLDALLMGLLYNPVIVPHDLGQVQYHNGKKRLYITSAGTGFDASVCHDVNVSTLKPFLNKIGLSKLIYGGIALRHIVWHKKLGCTLNIDGEVLHTDRLFLLTFMNHSYEGGGFKFCPDAKPNDGLLDLCMASNITRPEIVTSFIKALKGQHKGHPKITLRQFKHLEVQLSSPQWLHTDGEVHQKETIFTVDVLPQVLNLITIERPISSK